METSYETVLIYRCTRLGVVKYGLVGNYIMLCVHLALVHSGSSSCGVVSIDATLTNAAGYPFHCKAPARWAFSIFRFVVSFITLLLWP